MTNQEKVRTRYPHASAEQESSGIWFVWDISPAEQERLDEKYGPERFVRGLFGTGSTEDEAWAHAVRKIERREVRRLPAAD